jgi:hypothetical protein
MSAISFPLTTDISSATNQVSSQKGEQLPAGGGGSPTVRQPDTVTLSAVFPPPPPVDTANSVQLQFQGAAQSAIQAFPPAPTQTAVSPAANATTPTTLSQQEQLVQLDQVLVQLGINPQSISLDNRLALIKSTNDPPALLNLVRILGALNTSATTAQQIVLIANNLSNPVPTGTQAQVPAQNESPAQPAPANTTSFQSSNSSAGLGFETTLQAGSGRGASVGQNTAVSNAAAQFQELQAVFQGTENPQNPGGGRGVVPAPSLNIQG